MLCMLLKLDGLELNCNGLIGPRSESSSSSTIAQDDRVNTFRLLAGDCSLVNSRFLRSDSFGVGARRKCVLLRVCGVIFIWSMDRNNIIARILNITILRMQWANVIIFNRIFRRFNLHCPHISILNQVVECNLESAFACTYFLENHQIKYTFTSQKSDTQCRKLLFTATKTDALIWNYCQSETDSRVKLYTDRFPCAFVRT